jgi:hypothetical protein
MINDVREKAEFGLVSFTCTISGGSEGFKVEEGSSVKGEDGNQSTQEGCYLWIS